MQSPSFEEGKYERELLVYSFLQQACIKNQGSRDLLCASTNKVPAFKELRFWKREINKIIIGEVLC